MTLTVDTMGCVVVVESKGHILIFCYTARSGLFTHLNVAGNPDCTVEAITYSWFMFQELV